MKAIRQFLVDLLRPGWKRRFYGGLIFMIFLLLFAFFYTPYSLEGGDAGIKIIFCPFRNMTGLPCPGCGMTRAVCHLAHGELATGLSLHWFSPLFFIAVFLELANSIVGIARKGRGLFYWGELFRRGYVKYPLFVFATVIIAYNFHRIWVLFNTSPEFSETFHDSIILRIVRLFS